jgi:transcription initiation protein SPT3
MTREQYVFYSECRQASFTYRKCESKPLRKRPQADIPSTAKRFKDFINASAFLDVKPNEDVMDILGFLAFEMVRTLCMAGLALRNRAAGITKADLERERVEAERAFRERQEAERVEAEEKEAEERRLEEERLKKEEEERTVVGEGSDGAVAGADVKAEDIDKQDVKMSSPSKPTPTDPQPPPAHTSPKKPSKQTAAQKLTGIAALLPPPTASQAVPLLPEHILGAYAGIQREQGMKKNGGLRNWRAGAPRSRAKLL